MLLYAIYSFSMFPVFYLKRIMLWRADCHRSCTVKTMNCTAVLTHSTHPLCKVPSFLAAQTDRKAK